MNSSRRDFLKRLGGAAAVAAVGPHLSSCTSFATQSSSKRPPNILLLMTDQHNFRTMGHKGDPNALTPVLDRLAASGTVFARAYCQNPVCAPSRMSILTGRYSHSHGTMSNYHQTPRQFTSFTQVLRRHGYRAACFGHLHIKGRDDLDWDVVNPKRDWPKWQAPEGYKPIGSFGGGNRLGRPAMAPEEFSRPWHTKEETVRFMNENRDVPWFVQCSFYKPHPPFQPPAKYWDMIDRSKLVIPSYPEDDLDDVNPRLRKQMMSRKLLNLTDDQILDALQGYYGNLAFCDAMFGKVTEALDKLGLTENTLIVHAADHGEMLGNHHMWTKFNFFEESVHVPLLMSLPGVVREGRSCDALVELIDLFPTFMDSVGLETPESVQGISFYPAALGKTENHRDFVRSEFAGGMLMHFDGRYKFIDNGENALPELYDLEKDPREITNVAGTPEHRARVETLTAELRNWARKDVVVAPFNQSYYNMLEKREKGQTGRAR